MKPYYEKDGITIYHGDCREIIPYLFFIDLCFTSPPYNTLGWFSKTPTGIWGKTDGGSGFHKTIKTQGYPDKMKESEYQKEQLEIIELIAKALVSGGCLFYNHKCRWRNGKLIHPILWVQPKDLVLRQEIIWNRFGS